MNSKILSINSYLISILPITLIFSIFLSDLIVICSSIFFLIFIFKNKKFYLFNILEFKIFILLYSTVLLSILFSDLNSESIIKGIAYFRFGLLIVLIKYLIDFDKNFLNLFIKFLIYAVLILFLGVLLQFFNFEYFTLFKPYSRFTSFFEDESILGSFLIKIIPLLIAILFYQKKKKLFLLVLFLGCTMIFLSAERSAILLLLIFLFALFFFTKLYSIYIKGILILLIITISFSILKFSPETKFRVYNKTLFQLGIIEPERKYVEFKVLDKWVGVVKEDYFIPLKYFLMFKTSINIFKDNYFFGAGVKSFRDECKKDKYYIIENYSAFKDKPYDHYPGYTGIDGCSTHPHNYYFQLLSETGIFSFIIVILTFLWSVYNFFIKKEIYIKIIYLGIIINLFPFVFTGSFYNNFISILIYLPIGFLHVKSMENI